MWNGSNQNSRHYRADTECGTDGRTDRRSETNIAPNNFIVRYNNQLLWWNFWSITDPCSQYDRQDHDPIEAGSFVKSDHIEKLWVARNYWSDHVISSDRIISGIGANSHKFFNFAPWRSISGRNHRRPQESPEIIRRKCLSILWQYAIQIINSHSMTWYWHTIL